MIRLLFCLIGCFHLLGNYPNFEDHPLLTTTMQKMMAPHLLPLDHPAKPMLDLVFSKPKVLRNEESIRNAGFSIITIQPKSAMIVARHPLVPGFIFKMYRDLEPTGRNNIPGWECLTQRCANAKKVKKTLEKNHLRYFSVPDKWLYILPLNSHHIRKNQQPVVLIATDMEIETEENTRIAWKTAITHRHLDELYVILKAGYGSSYLINNMPYTKHETFAIIDIEKPKRTFDLKRVEKYFSDDMQRYWRHLID